MQSLEYIIFYRHTTPLGWRSVREIVLECPKSVGSKLGYNSLNSVCSFDRYRRSTVYATSYTCYKLTAYATNYTCHRKLIVYGTRDAFLFGEGQNFTHHRCQFSGFDGVSASVDINIPPLQGTWVFAWKRCYKHTAPTGLKRVLKSLTFLRRIRFG